ncbi:MAG: SufS family cysteine desulfurase [Thermoplasmata archaeon]|nr:SufS family cysteine desulfurase [Thermoplasmata archaeon]
MDVERIRRDFPILNRSFHGHPLAYLDSAASSQKPTVVLEAEREFYEQRNANVRRGVYALSEEATAAYEKARERVARFLGVRDPQEIIFVRGTTEALNVVASGLGQTRLRHGGRVVTTIMEHHSNIVPWHMLRERSGVDLRFIDIDDDGRLRMEEYDEALDASAKVVTLSHVSNVLGTVNPVREIADRAHDAGALVVVDAAQSAPHRPMDVEALGADFVAFSGHKTLGPMGIGVLWGRGDLLRELPPFMGGGEMIRSVHTDRVEYADPPARFEAGTPNVAGACALSVALDYLERVGWDDMAAHEHQLLERAVRLANERFEGTVRIYGPPLSEGHEAVLSFSVNGVHPHDVATILDQEGLAIRSGHHCAQPLMERLKVPALSRASVYLYNTTEEIDRLFGALEKVNTVFAA